MYIEKETRKQKEIERRRERGKERIDSRKKCKKLCRPSRPCWPPGNVVYIPLLNAYEYPMCYGGRTNDLFLCHDAVKFSFYIIISKKIHPVSLFLEIKDQAQRPFVDNRLTLKTNRINSPKH